MVRAQGKCGILVDTGFLKEKALHASGMRQQKVSLLGHQLRDGKRTPSQLLVIKPIKHSFQIALRSLDRIKHILSGKRFPADVFDAAFYVTLFM